MKDIFLKSRKLNWLLPLLVVAGFASCRKDNSLGFTPGTGTPTITSVHTLSKTDTSKVPRVTTAIDNQGNVTTDTIDYPINPAGFDSLTTSGTKGSYYVIYGTNLGSTTTITFNGVSAYFNRALISDNSLIVSIPNSVPTTGSAANNKLVVTTLYGSVSYNFTVLSPPPTITTPSDYDFWSGYQVTLAGVGFSTVTSVGLTGSTATCTIISQTDAQLVIQFPTTSVNTASLVFSYASGGKTVNVTSTQVFNDLDNAYTIFFKNSFQNSWGDNSWSGPSGVSTNASHSGTASAEATYPSNGWKIEGWANWYPSFPYSASYQYLTFWVKGGSVDQTLTLVGDKMVGGYGQNTSPAAIQQIDVPPNVWTYYKIPLGTGSGQLNYWATGSPAQQLGFFLKGQGSDPNETMYFDEVAFVK